MDLPIGTNIKRLREERKVTQEQLAERLNISFQSVSKWETGISAPDIALLPEISEFFEISIDELFKPDMRAYRDTAERHLCEFEADNRNDEKFNRAKHEYDKFIESGDMDCKKWMDYAYLYDCRYLADQYFSIMYYNRAIEVGEAERGYNYYKAQRQLIQFLGREQPPNNREEYHKTLLEKEPDIAENYHSLALFYNFAAKPKEAWEVLPRGIAQFPNNQLLLTEAGDTARNLGRFEVHPKIKLSMVDIAS